MKEVYTWAAYYIKVVDELWETEAYDEGYKILRDILAEEPGYALAHSYAGWYAHNIKSDKKTARMHYEYALHFDNTLMAAYYNFARLLVEELDEVRLRKLIAESINVVAVDKSNLYNELGRILEMKGKYELASKTYKKAMEDAMDEYVMKVIKDNRKRVIKKYHLFSAWYSFML